MVCVGMSVLLWGIMQFSRRPTDKAQVRLCWHKSNNLLWEKVFPNIQITLVSWEISMNGKGMAMNGARSWFGYISSRPIWFSLVSLKQQMVARHFIDAYCLLNISIHIASTSLTDIWTRKPLVLHWLSTVKNVSNVTAEKPLIVFKTSNRSAWFLLCSFLQWANSKSLQPIILEKFRPGK